jgi:hypothetical protein
MRPALANFKVLKLFASRFLFTDSIWEYPLNPDPGYALK